MDIKKEKSIIDEYAKQGVFTFNRNYYHSVDKITKEEVGLLMEYAEQLGYICVPTQIESYSIGFKGVRFQETDVKIVK